MPKRTMIVNPVLGIATDKAKDSPDPSALNALEGFVPLPVYGGRNALVVADGDDQLNFRPLQRAPLEGATGEPATTSLNENSAVGTMTLVMFSEPNIRGNLFAWVRNGDGSNLRSDQAGMQGRVESVYQEMWGGDARYSMGGPDFAEGDDVDTEVGGVPD